MNANKVCEWTRKEQILIADTLKGIYPQITQITVFG